MVLILFFFTFPFQKRKMSLSENDDSREVPTKNKHYQHGKHWSCQAATPLDTVSTCLPGSSKKPTAPEDETVEGSCTAEHEFTYSSGTLSRPLFLKRENKNQKQSAISLPSSCEIPATQDSSVSSSDIITTTTDSP